MTVEVVAPPLWIEVMSVVLTVYPLVLEDEATVPPGHERANVPPMVMLDAPPEAPAAPPLPTTTEIVEEVEGEAQTASTLTPPLPPRPVIPKGPDDPAVPPPPPPTQIKVAS